MVTAPEAFTVNSQTWGRTLCTVAAELASVAACAYGPTGQLPERRVLIELEVARRHVHGLSRRVSLENKSVKEL
jgi:hypothetical protein